MKKLASSFVALALVALTHPMPVQASRRSAAPPRVAPSWPLSPTGPQLPATGVIFGAHVGIDPLWTGSDRKSAQAAVEASIGRTLVIDRQYYFWDQQFPTADDDLSRDQGRTLYISMTAFNSNGTVNLWKDIAAGVYDATIDARAADIKAFGAPMFFTFHHEPNKGHGGVSAGTPAEFIAAWQHIHDKFVADGVTNVSWALTLMAITYKNHKGDTYYPGDSYVDILAADGYNWFGCNQPSGPWVEVKQIFQPFYNYGLTKNKPMIIAEWGTGEDPADPTRKMNWFINGLAQFKLWPQIKGVSYYDSTHGHSDCPRWINTSTNSITGFTTIGADPYSNPYPITTVTSGPTNPTTSTTATFTWTSTTGTGTSVTFVCSLDNGPATACTSGKTYTGLALGGHLFMVTPTDNTGATGNPGAWEWTITT